MIIKDRFDPATGKNTQEANFAASLFQPHDPEDDVEEPITDELLAEWATSRGFISSRDGHELARMLVECRRFLAKLRRYWRGGMMWPGAHEELDALLDNR